MYAIGLMDFQPLGVKVPPSPSAVEVSQHFDDQCHNVIPSSGGLAARSVHRVKLSLAKFTPFYLRGYPSIAKRRTDLAAKPPDEGIHLVAATVSPSPIYVLWISKVFCGWLSLIVINSILSSLRKRFRICPRLKTTTISL